MCQHPINPVSSRALKSYFHIRKWNLFQMLEMGIFRNNITGIGGNGTVHKLVVVLILFNQMEVEIDIHILHERRIDQHLDDIGGNDGVRLAGDDFFVFFKDVIGNTEDVLSFVQSSPYREIISSP